MNHKKKIQELTKRVHLLQSIAVSNLATPDEHEAAEDEIKELTAEINRLLDESIAARLD